LALSNRPARVVAASSGGLRPAVAFSGPLAAQAGASLVAVPAAAAACSEAVSAAAGGCSERAAQEGAYLGQLAAAAVAYLAPVPGSLHSAARRLAFLAPERALARP
jgi:hypothetical protein